MTIAANEKTTAGNIKDRLAAITAKERTDATACFRRSVFTLAEGGELNPAELVAFHAAMKTLGYPTDKIHEAEKAIAAARELQSRIDEPYDLPALQREAKSTRAALRDELTAALARFATTAPDEESLRLFIIRISANSNWTFGTVPATFGLECTQAAAAATFALSHAQDDPRRAAQELSVHKRHNPDLWDPA
jgi:hypothetical protein